MTWACAATRLLAGASLLFFFKPAKGASLTAQAVSSEAAFKRADSTARVALHTRAQKAAAVRAGLRSASAFRAARAGTSTRASLRSRMSTHQTPLYVEKIGLANVTEPTAYPPPPPELHAWEDMQPVDTAVGHLIISGFMSPPTVTPPPTQQSLDLAFACPVLLTWPSEVSVSVPDECASMTNGKWTGSQDKMLINWETTCFDSSTPGVHTPQVSSVTTYTMENGDLFGTSQLQPTGLFSNAIVLRDCGGAALFTVEEKLYKQTGKPIDDVCEKYASCDGVVYLQYFIKNSQGTTVAFTPYLTLFQDSFKITDTTGVLIAEVSRNGWAPPIKTACSDGKKKTWDIKFASSPPGIWASAANQWPIAEMMTMLAQRDKLRQPNGHVIWSNCEVLKTTSLITSAGLILCACMCLPFLCFIFCSGPCSRIFGSMEGRCFPKRMGKPMMFGN